jgi:acetone carboxylase gamma subunit
MSIISDTIVAFVKGDSVQLQCRKCGNTISDGAKHWKDIVPRLETPVSKAGPLRSNSGKFKMREYLCPRCAVVLDVEVTLDSDPPLYDSVALNSATLRKV